MRFWPEIHWSEGQFLRPHHFQAAFRQIETHRLGLAAATHPYPWGFVSLDLAPDAIEGNLLEIRSCELLLRDGTYVKVPDNCIVDPRDFKKAFDQAAGAMPVYFGVPELQRVRANVQSAGEALDGRNPRYTIDLSELNDENTGENPQQIEVRRLRGAIFVGDEDRTGYSCIPLGKIERMAAGPALSKNIVPPLLRTKAWPALCAGVEAVWNALRSRCEQLGADAQQRQLSFSTAAPGDVEQLMKLWALNELTVRFGAFVSSPELHPHPLYMLMVESIGKLTLWDEMRRPRELPPYDHDNLGPVFKELIDYLQVLIDKILGGKFEKVLFEKRDTGFFVALDQKWLSPKYEMYMGLKSQLQHHEISELFGKVNFRLGSPTTAEEVFMRRLSGLALSYAGAVPNLPRESDLSFFRVARTPPFWTKCEEERAIFIRVPPDAFSKLSPVREIALYVVELRK